MCLAWAMQLLLAGLAFVVLVAVKARLDGGMLWAVLAISFMVGVNKLLSVLFAL
ncbi:MAG: hypothetical protein OEZ36_05115 [Spirochaetota bacterium]|nr:hypothetical protein [Spirochaetota bacterium]